MHIPRGVRLNLARPKPLSRSTSSTTDRLTLVSGTKQLVDDISTCAHKPARSQPARQLKIATPPHPKRCCSSTPSPQVKPSVSRPNASTPVRYSGTNAAKPRLMEHPTPKSPRSEGPLPGVGPQGPQRNLSSQDTGVRTGNPTTPILNFYVRCRWWWRYLGSSLHSEPDTSDAKDDPPAGRP